jgi:hypothetical protein
MRRNIEYLEQIKQVELQNLDGLTRSFCNMEIHTTREIINSNEIKSNINEKEFKPEFYFKYAVIIIFTLVFIVMGMSLKNNSVGEIIFVVCFIGIISFSIINYFIINKKVNFKITINHKGIFVENKEFQWKNIYDTAILTRSKGKGYVDYLIIVLQNDENLKYEKFNLSRFSIFHFGFFSYKLSRYIEYFKSKSKN